MTHEALQVLCEKKATELCKQDMTFRALTDSLLIFANEIQQVEKEYSQPSSPEAQARQLLLTIDLVYGKDEDCQDGDQVLNMNDTWGWATAWDEHIPDKELLIVAELVRRYGYCGALYWVSERHNHLRSEFEDINRFVEFVRQEEAIRKDVPNSSQRAYTKRSYVLGL